jgi:DNA topoisomerase-1
MEPTEVDMETAVSLLKQKQEADAPIAIFDGLPVTKGKGRFGPFIKWNDLYINVPKAYNYDELRQSDIDELIGKKVTKEANRFIQQWAPEKVSIENGRWGPFVRFGKKMLKLARKPGGDKYTPEEAATLTLEQVKGMIEEQVPGAFTKKAAAKKASAKKPAAKKSGVKRAAPKKVPKKK